MKLKNNFEEQYINLLNEVMTDGKDHKDRTGVGRRSIYGANLAINLSSFPILQTKHVSFHNIKHELLWFLGNHLQSPLYNSLDNPHTNIKYLVDNGVNIWNEWPYQNYVNKTKDQISLKEFKELIKVDYNFANKWGNAGPIYGKQWRNYDGIDQIKNIITSLRENPFSTRHIVSSWNVSEINKMLLPPCHNMFQFLVTPEKELICIFNMRSTDVFLGLPYNIASYALLTHIIAVECNLIPKGLIYNGSDVHIYHNHFDVVNTQISRYNENLKNLTSVKISDFPMDVLTGEDIKLLDYSPLGKLVAPVAI